MKTDNVKPQDDSGKNLEEKIPDTALTQPLDPVAEEKNEPIIEIRDAVPMQAGAVAADEEPIKKVNPPVAEIEKAKEEATDKTEEEKVEKVEDKEKTEDENLVEKSAEVKEKIEKKVVSKPAGQSGLQASEVDATDDLDKKTVTENEKKNDSKVSSWDLEEESSPLDKKNKNFFKLGIIVLIIILAITGIVFFFFFNSSSKTAPVEEKKTVEPTKALEKAQIDKSEWTLEVLNGSGVAGAAAKAAAKLTEQGYTVISTGNADNQDYKKSELFVAENMQSKAQLLIDDLKDAYGLTEVKSILKDSTASAQIILGSE